MFGLPIPIVSWFFLYAEDVTNPAPAGSSSWLVKHAHFRASYTTQQ